MKTEKNYLVRVVATLAVPYDVVEDEKTLAADICHEFIKVKGGLYENIAFGFVDSAEVIGTEDVSDD